MWGLVKTGRGEGLVELQEVPEPQPGPGEVLIEVRAASVCGSDVHIYHDRHPYWPPVVLGHEFAGVVAEVGPGVEGYRPGDRVVSETSTGACGRCFLCRTGNRQICPDKRAPGIGRNGAFARYLVMPAELLHRIPDGLSFEEAAATEPTAVAVHAVAERAAVRPGERVVVLGPGPIGLLCLQVARACGAAWVAVVGTPRSAGRRLPAARELGGIPIELGREDPLARVAELTDGQGADVVLETSGSPAAVALAPHLARRLGRVCELGVTGRREVAFPWDVALFKGLDVQFSFSSRHSSWVLALRLLAEGKVRTGPLLDVRLPLGRWREAFEAAESGRAIKALLYPQEV